MLIPQLPAGTLDLHNIQSGSNGNGMLMMADEEERTRLNIQHEGWKAVNGGKNYLAPIDKVLINEGEGKRVLDIGTGEPWYPALSLLVVILTTKVLESGQKRLPKSSPKPM